MEGGEERGNRRRGERRFNNLQWGGGVRKENALNDDNKEKGTERESKA